MFIPQSPLWTDLDCEDEDKTRVYLERSKSLPTNLSLYADDSLPPCHPILEASLHAIGRLRSLSMEGTLEYTVTEVGVGAELLHLVFFVESRELLVDL